MHELADVVRDMESILPRKPRLAPWVTPVDLGDGRLQLRSSGSSFTIGHPFLAALFSTIGPSLDGSLTIEEIAQTGGPGVLPTSVIFLLKALNAQGLLQDAEVPAPLSGADLVRWERQLRFFGHFTPEPMAAQAALRAARVGVIASRDVRDPLMAAAEALGIGEVRACTPAGDGDWAGYRDLDLLIAWLDAADSETPEAINAGCLASGIRWMHVAIEGTTPLLGPTFVPRQTACYTCYTVRARSHVPDLEGWLAQRAHVQAGKPWSDEGMLEPLAAVLRGHVALEIARLLTGFAPPVTIGRCYEWNALHPTPVIHEVFRVPRCPSCGGRQPVGAAWAPGVA